MKTEVKCLKTYHFDHDPFEYCWNLNFPSFAWKTRRNPPSAWRLSSTTAKRSSTTEAFGAFSECSRYAFEHMDITRKSRREKAMVRLTQPTKRFDTKGNFYDRSHETSLTGTPPGLFVGGLWGTAPYPPIPLLFPAHYYVGKKVGTVWYRGGVGGGWYSRIR